MSVLTDRLVNAAAQSEGVLGDSFTLQSKTFTGTISDESDAPDLVAAGFESDIDRNIVATKPQFATKNVTPAVGQIVTINGQDYKIFSTSEDQLYFTLNLKSENQ